MPKTMRTKLDTRVKIQNSDGEGLSTIRIEGYTGASVDLYDYGFDKPVVYNIKGIRTKQKIAILYKHQNEIGHTTSVRKPGNQGKLTARGVLSVPSEETSRVDKGTEQGFPYQASMGVDFFLEDVAYHPEGTKVNGRNFKGPTYVVEKSELTELSVTPFGRDGDTSTTKLSKDQLMTVKNTKTNDTPKEPPKETTKLSVEDGKITLPDGTMYEVELAQPPKDKTPPPESPEGDSVVTMTQLSKLLEGVGKTEGASDSFLLFEARLDKHEAHVNPDLRKMIRQSIEDEWDDARTEREVEFYKLKNSLPTAPGVHITSGVSENQANVMKARLGISLGVTEERLATNLGKKEVDEALSVGDVGLQEMIVKSANSLGGGFSGFNDVEAASEHIKNAHSRQSPVSAKNAYSTIDMPNSFEGMIKMKVEDAFEINPPFAQSVCVEGSTPDFRPDPRIIINGGEVWEGLNPDGSIKLMQVGKEEPYSVRTRTIARGLVIRREHAINDAMGVIRELVDQMVEGAVMVPDIKFVKLFYSGSYFDAANNNLLTSGSTNGALLDRDTLQDAETLAKTRRRDKGTVDAQANLNTRWSIIHPTTLNQTVFDIIQQPILLASDANDGASPPRGIGTRNYWYQRATAQEFVNMNNETYDKAANDNAWALWPQNKKYSPYEITYLQGKKRPTTETIDLPWEFLGWGMRGYWEVEINERSLVNTSAVKCDNALA